jgi:hypothetical protein
MNYVADREHLPPTPLASARLWQAGEQFLLDLAESETVNGPEQN